MQELNRYNLRSLIFACQKTVDIFLNYQEPVNIEFFKQVFLGNVAFSLRLKGNDDIKWDNNTSPNRLGTSKYPLYKFCYEYIKYQDLDFLEIDAAQKDFLERQVFEKKQSETQTALNILYEFYKQKAITLNLAIISILDELKIGNTIPFTEYGKLVNYLILVRELVDNPQIIEECKNIMIEKIKTVVFKDDKILDRLRFHDSFNFWSEVQTKEYNEFMENLRSAYKHNIFTVSEDENSQEYLKKVTELMSSRNSSVHRSKGFFSNLYINKIVEGLEKATAEQVYEFRGAFLSVYNIANIRDFLPEDKEALIELRDKTRMLLDSGKGYDKIVRLQYAWLINNIDNVIENY